MRHTFIASTALLAALALAAPLSAQGHAVPREGSSASGSSGSSGGSSSGSGGSTVSSSGGGRQSAPRVGSSRSGGSSRGGGTSVRERSVPSSSGVGSPSSSTSGARARGRSGVVTGTSNAPAAIGAGPSRARDTSAITGRAVPRSSRPPILRSPDRWYYPGWSPISYYSPWLYGTYGLGSYFYDPWWMIWGPAYGPYGYGYDPYGYGGYGYGGYGGGYGGSYGGGGRSTTVSDFGQVRLKVKPGDAEVYVNGQRKGEVSEFDGVWERLEVPYGTHVIEVRHEGYQPRAWDVTLHSKDLVTIKGELKEK